MQEYLGRSPLRCDLAISEANGEQFSLGALLDGDAAAVANVGEPWQIDPCSSPLPSAPLAGRGLSSP
ncbi:hypothetical protein [Pseudomonas sp. BC42]|uniref:hypothetical protein n=1 Tax=Pseudomonas sp. BC42 TaxID=2933816 RepID=UPI001F35803B|nr:hypothetical protein [Pseudomonas sp. BC42]ULT67907.1 hypothetical protein L1O02_15925 [Pseudomonas sp. BC42]